MKKIFSLHACIGAILLFPLYVSAQATPTSVSGGFKSLAGMIDTFTETVVKSTATLFLSLALLAFFFGIVEYIWGKRQGDGGKVKVGNEFMKWGLLALFVMFSVYGIIQFAQSVLGLRGSVETIVIPKINFGGGGSSSSGGTNGGASTGVSSPGETNGSVGGYNSPEDYCIAYGGRWVNGACDGQTSSGGKKSNGSACSADTECSSQLCDFDTQKCVSQGSGATSFSKPNGSACSADTECSSQLCDFDTQKCVSQGSSRSSGGCSASNIGASCSNSVGDMGKCGATEFDYSCIVDGGSSSSGGNSGASGGPKQNGASCDTSSDCDSNYCTGVPPSRVCAQDPSALE